MIILDNIEDMIDFGFYEIIRNILKVVPGDI